MSFSFIQTKRKQDYEKLFSWYIPVFFAVKLLYFSVKILLCKPRTKVDKQWWKQRGKKAQLFKKKEKRDCTASVLAISQRVESRLIAVMVNHLKETKVPSYLYFDNVFFLILYMHSKIKTYILCGKLGFALLSTGNIQKALSSQVVAEFLTFR